MLVLFIPLQKIFGVWTEQQKITPNTLVPALSRFDRYMNRCGTRMIIGDYIDDEAATTLEHFMSLIINLINGYFNQLLDFPGVANAGFGINCAINDAGTVCVIGAFTKPNGSGNNRGAAYVYNIDDWWLYDNSSKISITKY